MMIMKSKYLYPLLALVLLLSSTGCSNDLNLDEHGVLSYDTYYKTDEEAESAVTSCYLKMRSMEYNYKLIKNMLSDDFWAGGGGRGDNSELEGLNEFTFDASQNYIKSLFQTYYGIIYAANVAITHIPDESAVQKQMRAEAKVFRAWAYFELISMWGTPPIVDHELEASEYNQPNGTTDKLWEMVNTDLTEAINSGCLTQKSSIDDNSNYRVTKQFAQALLGKAYLWQKEYAKAAEQLNAVVDSKLYGLYQGDFGDILAYDHENNRESVFELNRVDDATNVWDNQTLFALMTGWRTDCMTISTSGIYSNGWGFCNPRKSLYNAFVAEEGADGYRLNQTMKTYAQMVAMGNTVSSGKTIINEGLFTWKTRVQTGEIPSAGYGFCDVNNIRIMRYAEVLLLAAEANLEAGNQTLAAKDVNEVRTRAKLASKSAVTLDDIKTEKRLELCFEYIRFQDLIRWGEGEKYMGTQGENCPILDSNGNITYKSYNSEGKYGFKTRNNLLPFPSTEMSLNSNIKQNEGW
jgi:hypothetical protein